MTRAPTMPRIRHLPTSTAGADDLLWDDAARFVGEEVVVVEKLDGVHVTFARGRGGAIEWAVKSAWAHADQGGLARAISLYARLRGEAIRALVDDGAHLHAEWLRHRVSTPYDALPDELVATGLLRRGRAGWRYVDDLDAAARIRAAGLTPNVFLFTGRAPSLAALTALVGTSDYGPARMEGIVVARRADPGPDRFAKWVGPWYRPPVAGVLDGAKNGLSDDARRAIAPGWTPPHRSSPPSIPRRSSAARTRSSGS